MRFSKLLSRARGLVILGMVSGLWAQPTSFVICDEVGDQREPVVIYDSDNGNFIVAWTDGRGWPKKIYGARVDTLGNVLEEDGTLLLSPVYAPNRDLILPEMAMWDTSFLLMARNIDAGYGCGNHVAAYRKDLSRIFTTGFFTFESIDFPEAGRVACSPFNDTALFLSTDYIWQEAYKVTYVGHLFPGDTDITGGSGGVPCRGWGMVWDSTRDLYLLAFDYNYLGWDGDTIGTYRMLSSSGLIDPDTLIMIRSRDKLRPASFEFDERSRKDRDVCLRDQGFLIASETGGQRKIPPNWFCSRIWVDFLDTSGLPTRPLPFFFGDTLTRDSRWPTCANNEGSALVAWQDSIPDSVQIRAAFFDTLQNYDGPEVLIRGYRETQPDLIACPGSAGKFFLVWAHWNGPPTFYDIYGMFLDTIETVEVGLEERPVHTILPLVIIYPNPFSDETMISIPGLDGQAQVSVYDATGRKVKSFSVTGNEQKINPGPEGVYFLEVKAVGLCKTIKIVKTRR